jgi:DnaJ-class molecular chaperone
MSLYHQILGLPEGAGIDLIKSSYRALCKKYHPDLNDEESIGKMALINEAYAALAKSGAAAEAQGDRSDAPAAKKDLALYRHQAYAFYKQGIKHFRLADDGLVFRDSNEWNGETRRFDKPGRQNDYEKSLYRALYYFNLVCSEFPESEWRDDCLDKIRQLNQKRVFLARWRARFEK